MGIAAINRNSSIEVILAVFATFILLSTLVKIE